MKTKILILGSGIASSAYASILVHKKIEGVILGSPFDNHLIQSFKKNKMDKRNKIRFGKKINFLFDDEHSILKKKKFNLIIVGTNSKGLSWAIKRLNDLKIVSPILLITKGLVKKNNKVLTISSLFEKSCFNKNVVMAAGPCLASELISKNNTRTLFASKKIQHAKLAKKILETNYYHPDLSKDIIGAEVCAAIKNIYATIIGSSKNTDTQNLFNPSSALFEQSLKEMRLITNKMKGSTDTVFGLAGVGDLYVSVLGGRNSKLGSYLGKGMRYKRITNGVMKGVTVEGADLTMTLGKQILKTIGQKKLPLLNSLVKSIILDKKLKIDWKMFTH